MTVLVQRGLLAGVLDVLDVASDPQLLMLRPGLPVSSTPDLIITAVLHGLSVDEIRTRDVYPQLVLHGIETLKPNRDDAEALAPIAGTVHVGLTGFTGDWDVMELRMRVPGDPEGSGTPISLLVQKWTAPFRQATGSLPSPASGRAVVAARIERWQCPWIAAGGVFALGWMSGRLWLRLRHGT
jgi:hypothetical protein